MDDEYEMKTTEDGFCSNPQTTIFTAIKNNKLHSFVKHLQSGSVDPNLGSEPEYKSVLDLICAEGKSEFLKILLDYNPKLNEMNEFHKKYPIHFAVESRDMETIRILLNQPSVDINALSTGSNTPLHAAIKYLGTVTDPKKRENEINKSDEIVKLFLNSHADPNIPDTRGCPPISTAATSGLESIVQSILQYSQFDLDLDTYKNRKKQSSRDIISANFPHLQLESSMNGNTRVDIDVLFYDLVAKREDKFHKDFNSYYESVDDKSSIFRKDNGRHTLLQLAVDQGLNNCVQILLDKGADPNLVFKGNCNPAAAIACKNGDYVILQTIINSGKSSLDGSNGDSLLHIVVKEIGKPTNMRCDYKKCLNILLDQNNDSLNINRIDNKLCTALHYAVRSCDDQTVSKLLDKGAYIGTTNIFKDPPIAEISPKVLERYLDSCVQTNNQRMGEDGFEIRFNYNFLKPSCVPRRKSTKTKDGDSTYLMLDDKDSPELMADNQNKSREDEDHNYCSEMGPILFMSQCEELKCLLKHPIISSFLYLKWYRLSCIFRTNLIFYTIFCLSLILYILIGFGQTHEDQNVENVSFCLWMLTVIGLCVLMVREFFQLIVSPKRYLKQFENYLELGLIAVSIAILFCNLTDEHTMQQLSAVAILLAAAELMQLIGQLPNFSTNNVMLRTVSWNFFKFFALNSLLIVAFALSFYTLFREQPDDKNDAATVDNSTSNASEEDGDPNFFVHPGLALMKTFVMLTGEFDASSIKFGNYPITSHIIFVLFVFLITIVLFNLLNGLAVSDTQAIKSDAQLVGLKTRAKLLAYYECVLLGDVNLYALISSSIRRFFNCCFGPQLSNKRLRPFARIICLFPEYLPMNMVYVKMNQDNIIVIPPEKDDDEKNHGFCCIFNICQHKKMEYKIIKSARKILDRRGMRDCSIEDANLELKLNKLESKIERLEGSIEKILSIISKKE